MYSNLKKTKEFQFFKVYEMKPPEACLATRSDLRKTSRQGWEMLSYSPDLWQVPSSPNSLFSAVTHRRGINAQWSLSLLEEKCFNQLGLGTGPTFSHSHHKAFCKL